MPGLFLYAEIVERDAGGNGEVEAVDIGALWDEDWLRDLGEFGRKASSFVAENEGVMLAGEGELIELLGVWVEHESIERAGLVVGLIICEASELLNIEMENGAHGCADGLGVVRIDGRRDDGEILIAKSGGTAHDGAEIASIGRIDEDEMRLRGREVELYGRFGEFGGEEAAFFGAEDVESLGSLDNFDVFCAKLGENLLEIGAMFGVWAEENAPDEARLRAEKFKN